MTVLITMAGLASRFKERGYLPPKFRIVARGRTLMDWSLLSLQAFFGDQFIFACLDGEDGDWIRSTAAAIGIAEAVVAKRSGVGRGQAETAFDALMHAAPSEPLWIYNIVLAFGRTRCARKILARRPAACPCSTAASRT